MGLSINQNIAAVNSYRNLSNTQNDLSKSLEKLSSGFRINRAADDAAGLAISEGLRSQIGGLKQAVRNSQDGISVVQTAEGALTETHSILQRMRDLSVQAANDGGLSSDAKGNIQYEMSQMKDELTRIADTTQFNGTKLLDGTYDGKFQVGANVGETINVSIKGSAMSAAGLGIGGVDVTTTAEGISATVAQAVGTGTEAAGTVTTGVALGVSEGFDKLNGTLSYGGKSIDLSTVRYVEGSNAGDRLIALNKQVEAKLGAGISFDAAGVASGALPADEIAVSDPTAFAALQVGFTRATGADMAINKIDDAIKSVSTTRADLGAVQNRFDHTVKNLNVAVENLSASESRIRDTDMASEMVQFTRAQILSQAGTAMLAQANQIPQGVLSLLR
jgi:flagellin